MKEDISPEEKLLRLIKNGKKQALPLPLEKPVLSVLAKEKTLKPKSRLGMHPGFRRAISFFSVRKIILVVFAVSFINLVISFAWPWLRPRKIELIEPAQNKDIAPQGVAKIQAKPFEFYLGAIQNRKIFTSSLKEEEQGLNAGISSDLFKDINLVGIISGDNPQAVIEDKKAGKTYYVTKGQSIGEFLVKDIQEGKVILNYNGVNYELYI